jgi:hypothetical protein
VNLSGLLHVVMARQLIVPTVLNMDWDLPWVAVPKAVVFSTGWVALGALRVDDREWQRGCSRVDRRDRS